MKLSAIETILPPDIREIVRGNRGHAERDAAASARAQQDAKRQRERDAKHVTVPCAQAGNVLEELALEIAPALRVTGSLGDDS